MFLKNKTATVVLTLCLNVLSVSTYRPLVVCHGFNDSCEGAIKNIINRVKNTLPGIEVFCIRIGTNDAAEKRCSMFYPMKKQLESACEQLANITQLRNGFNALGESQGGLLMRAIVQKCPPGPVHNLITISSPHQGIYGIPKCYEKLPKLVCDIVTYLFTTGVYTKFVQGLLTAAQYWHDPYDEAGYVDGSTYLAEINNEKQFNLTFKMNLLKLNKLVLVRNADDDFIYPNFSSHFGFFKPGSVREQENFTSTRVYKDDLLGLKELQKSDRLVFETIPGKHCHIPPEWFNQFTLDYLQ